MTDTEKATLERRIDELCRENERLRQENQSIGVAAYELGRKSMADENAKLRELVRGLHVAYIGALNECEGTEAGLIWEYCDMVDAELAKSHARFEADRHRFDVAMRELGIEASDG